MKHRATAAALALAALLIVPGQIGRAEEKPVEQPAEETAKDIYTRLEKSVNDSRRAAVEAYKAAVAKEQKAAEAEGRAAVLPPYNMSAGPAAHIGEFQAAAEQFAGTDDAVQFLTWLARAARSDEAGKAAVQTLLATHLESGSLGRFVSMLPYLGRDLGDDRVSSVLATIIEKNPSADVKAQALITRGEMNRSKDQAAARADLERAAGLAGDAKIAGRARGILNEMEHLGIGATAPEITAADLDGVEFKLSDYRGKVVVLDFWGDW